jgi:hypothetical protein
MERTIKLAGKWKGPSSFIHKTHHILCEPSNISSPFHEAIWITAFQRKSRISWLKSGCQVGKEQIRHFLASSTERLLKR